MMKVTIDCAELTSKEAFHHRFAAELGLPPYYGENLDALYDCLSTLGKKTTITLLRVQALIDNLGSYGRAALNVLEQAERDNPQFLTINMM